jgi:putative ABC transport system permease protein
VTPRFHNVISMCRAVSSRITVYALMITGLSLSYCVAIVIALFVMDELSYDRFLPDADRVYLVSANYGPPGRPLVASDVTPAGVARWMKSDIASIESISRLSPVEWPMQTARRKVKERFYFADANIFEILQLPTLSGDLKTALSQPDTVVITERKARAYFGKSDVIGQILTTRYNTRLRVTAVLRNFPSNTHLDREIFVAGTSTASKLAIFDQSPHEQWPSLYTYVVFKKDTPLGSMPERLRQITRQHWEGPDNLPEGFELIPILKLHFQPHGDGQMKPRGHLNTVLAVSVVAIAILALASINFSGLVLAETNERSSEMALLTALGARRNDLIRQILQESLSVNAISALLALAVVERLLPALNQGLGLTLTLWGQAFSLLILLTLATLISAFLSGLYPALVVSKPYAARHLTFKARMGEDASDKWRGWVIAQLSLVVVLLIASHTMSRQWTYAIREAPNINGENVMMIRLGEDPASYRAFSNHVRALKGVQSVAESWGAPTTDYVRPAWINRPTGLITLTRTSVEPEFFKVYGVPLVAGENLTGTFLFPETPRFILLNVSAVRALGFKDARDSLGKEIAYETDRTTMRSRIVGVVPDLRFGTLYEPTQPMIFDNFSKYFTQLNVKIKSEDFDETVHQIDRLWQQDTIDAGPIDRRFYRDYLLEQYHDLRQQMRVFNLVSAIAIVLSMLGLTGLSIFLTRRQVREVAIYRALGATFMDILLFRLSPFLKPFLIANILGWVLAWVALKFWLGSFSNHIDLAVLSFVGAGVASLVFALVTVAAHSAMTVRKISVSSLRHE